MPLPDSQQEDTTLQIPFLSQEVEFLLARSKNQTGSGSGGSLAPRVQGPNQVPVVTGLKIIRTQNFLGGTLFTLVWQEPEELSNIDHYNIFVTRVLLDNRQPLGPYTAVKSPAQIFLTADKLRTVVFTVQTQMRSGLVSLLENSPSVAGKISAPVIHDGDVADISAVKITAGTLIASVVYSGTINTNQINAGTLNAVSLVLNTNGITTTVTNGNIFGAATGVDVKNNSTGRQVAIGDSFVAVYYDNAGTGNHLSFAAAIVNPGVDNSGIVRVSDGTGAGSLDGAGSRILLNGSSGKISLQQTLAGAAGASAGFFTINIGGTDFKVQVFNP